MHWRCPQTQEAFLEGRKERRKGRREGDKGTVWAPEGEVASGQLSTLPMSLLKVDRFVAPETPV